MSRDRRFRPAWTGPLEERVAPAPLAATIAPIPTAPLNVSGRGRSLQRSVTDSINVAFDGFTRDYLEAQGAYFSITTPTGSPRVYFREFVVKRLALLSQQLTQVFTHLPDGLSRVRGGGGSLVVTNFLRTRITGNGPLSLSNALAGPTPNSPTIPQPGTAVGATATLYTTQALTAIEATRSATLNASGFLLHRTFNNGHG